MLETEAVVLTATLVLEFEGGIFELARIFDL